MLNLTPSIPIPPPAPVIRTTLTSSAGFGKYMLNPQPLPPR
jgi:hypothetical protein